MSRDQSARAPERRTLVVQRTAREWMATGRLQVPPDDTSADDDLAFWEEVDRRLDELESGSE